MESVVCEVVQFAHVPHEWAWLFTFCARDELKAEVLNVNQQLVMLQLLSARECGLDPPWLLPRSYGSHRFSRLELSKEKQLPRAHHATVNSLDLDCDGR